MRMKKKILATSIAAITVPFVPALAQTAQPDESPQKLEAVTITARRQIERLVDVPASVSVLTREQLTRTGVDRVSGVIQFTPGVSIVTEIGRAHV